MKRSSVLASVLASSAVWAAVLPAAQAGIIGSYSFTGNSTATLQSGYSHVTFSTFSRSATVTAVTDSTHFNSSTWSTSSALDDTHYAGFTITADAGYKVTFSQVTFDYRRQDQASSNDGPSSLAVSYSTDGFATVGGTSTTLSPVNNTTVTGASYNPTDVTTGNGGSVDVRFYGWSAHKNNGQLWLDNVSFEGDVVALARLAVTANMPGRVIRGTTLAVPIAITNTNIATGSETQDTLNYSVTGSNGLTGSKTGTGLAAGGTANATFTVDVSTVGQKNTTISVGSNNAWTGGVSINGTAGTTATLSTNVVADRTLSATAVDFGKMLVNRSTQRTTTISSTANDYSATRVTLGAADQTASASHGTITLVGSGTEFNYGANPGSAPGSITRTLSAVFTNPGNRSGTVNFTPTGEAGLTGQTVQPMAVTYTAKVYNSAALSAQISAGHIVVADDASAELVAAARVTGKSVTAGFTVNGLNVGDVINPGSPVDAVVTYNNGAGKLNGRYWGDVTLTAENDDQTILGAAPNDVWSGQQGHFAISADVTTNSDHGSLFVGANGAYAGYGMKSGGAHTTVATLRDGKAGASGRTVAMDFSDAPAECLSDMVNVSGMGSDLYVLEMTYDESLVHPGKRFASTEEELNVGMVDGTGWHLAVEGNGIVPHQRYQGYSYSAYVAAVGTPVLGDYGVDPVSNTTWAVLNYSGDFMVVPEPATLGLLVVGAMGLMRRRR